MVKAFLIFQLFSFSMRAIASECLPTAQSFNFQTQDISVIAQKSICETVKYIKTQNEFDLVIRAMMAKQALELANISADRHQVAEHLNDCTPEKDSKALVINFAGTGGFNPKSFDVMTDFMSCFAENKLAPELNRNVFFSISTSQQKLHSADYKWDAIEAGPLNLFASDSFLKTQAKFLDFATFASEETELIADPTHLSWEQLKKIPEEISRSTGGTPKGISMAMSCIQKYLTTARGLGIKPKIIVLTHSSGARSAVKFAENLKQMTNPLTNKKDYKLDLVLSMDPVKEAHEAFKEVASQYAGRISDRILDYIPFVDRPDKPINIWTREQPASLYKPSNTSRWVNVYQNSDTDGIKGQIKFGIGGSPIANADYNDFINTGLGTDGHGAITSHYETNQLFISEMKVLLGK